MAKTHEEYKAEVFGGRTHLRCGYQGSHCIGDVPIADGRQIKVDFRKFFENKNPWELDLGDAEAANLVLCEKCIDELKTATTWSGQKLDLVYVKRTADDLANARACHFRPIEEAAARRAAKAAREEKASAFLAKIGLPQTGERRATVPFPNKQAVNA